MKNGMLKFWLNIPSLNDNINQFKWWKLRIFL